MQFFWLLLPALRNVQLHQFLEYGVQLWLLVVLFFVSKQLIDADGLLQHDALVLASHLLERIEVTLFTRVH